MKKRADKSPYFDRTGAAREVLPLLISGIAVILFSTAGFARMMGWGLTSTGDSGDILALAQAAPAPTASEARARPKCPECGVIVSTRGYEITIRMADGSSRVINEAYPARWRTGERLIVIAGTDPWQQ
ncbi:MAG: hypothetical protein A3I02_04475 [Betaproteobacteria bacterium RIFCSPLOWO2_02_FULL_67_26]|nr:MAG: hypothetical protein A3I02_04475 [Betaproteobacteria bacterium RIFCSPLOWO2_02_FULL_67_26]